MVTLAIAAVCCLLYFGVKLTVAAVGWVIAFPFRHPFLFIGGVILLFLVAVGAAEETASEKKTQFAHGPPVPKHPGTTTAETNPPCQVVESSEPQMFVYLMKNELNGYYKIGRSKSPRYRERTLQSQEPEVSLKWKMEGTNEDEKHLHRKYKDVRLRGEWFSLTHQDVQWITSCESRDDLYRDATSD
ncbi:hypothetical protein CA51_26840 [Rosistilla oblonga]|nr:hypothetical protein CA51_26840 [Rosistilla oblonga]